MSIPQPDATVNPVELTLREAFRQAEQARSEAALEFFGQEFTFAELRSSVDALASAWQSRGIVKSDAILVQLQNVPQFVIAALAAWELGAITVPVSPMYKTREVRRILNDSQAVAWVTTPNIWDRQGAETFENSSLQQVYVTTVDEYGNDIPAAFRGIEDAQLDLEALPHVTSLSNIMASFAGQTPERVDLHPGDTANFTYTSGTTGPPKAALTSHANLAFVGYTYAAFHGAAGPEHTVLATAPLVHTTGLAQHIGSWLTHAQKLVLTYRFNPEVHLDAFSRTRATWTTGAATAYMAMLHLNDEVVRDFSTLKFVGCGGAPIPTDLAKRLEDFFEAPLKPGYGLTESTGAITSTPAGETLRIDESSGIISVGRIFEHSAVKIVDSHGVELHAGERGEIVLKGPGVVAGYWQNEAETANVFLDGWLRTGDVGFLDDDEWLYIVDRTKNMIVASGYNVWPREVEDVLYQRPEIREVAVVGAPDEYRGETVVAAVSLSKAGKETDWANLEQELLTYCKSHLANYKVPSRFVLKDELPKNFNGKIQHREIVAEITQQAEDKLGQEN